MSGVSGAGAGTRSAKISAALSEAGVKDTNNLAAEVKVDLRADVNAQSALDNLSQASAVSAAAAAWPPTPGRSRPPAMPWAARGTLSSPRPLRWARPSIPWSRKRWS